MMKNENFRVAIIGGGYAGLSAASELAFRNIKTIVFEASPSLGGRARGISFKNAGLDNGAHIFSGAYRETLRMMQLVGALQDAFLRIPLQIEIKDRFKLKAKTLPSPFNLLVGILLAEGISIKERLQIIRFMHSMQKCNFHLPKDITLTELLDQYKQAKALQKYMWEPICVAALNTLPKDASAQIFLNVLRDGVVNGKKEASDFLLPRVDLSNVFPNRAAEYIQSKNGDINLLSPVEKITAQDGCFEVHVKNGLEKVDAVILSVGPHQASSLLNDLPSMSHMLEQLNQFSYEPICTVYLQYDVDIPMHTPMLGFDSELIHWVFDRQTSHGQHGLLAAVTSASGRHLEMEKEELANAVAKEMTEHFPELQKPLWSKVITEKFATFSCKPGLKRPGNITPLKNFFIAGDYTDSEYPATIESAVRSGVKCAHLLLGETA